MSVNKSKFLLFPCLRVNLAYPTSGLTLLKLLQKLLFIIWVLYSFQKDSNSQQKTKINVGNNKNSEHKVEPSLHTTLRKMKK